MIFVAVGTQLPFDRLVGAVDEWAFRAGRDDVFGQVGKTSLSLKSIDAVDFIGPVEFLERCRAASLLVAHAGMGSILGALELRKPLIIMPRLASRGEHRNDHQLATAKSFVGKAGIYVAHDESEICDLLDRSVDLIGGEGISQYADPQLISTLRTFIFEKD